jgi:hypothetical protein
MNTRVATASCAGKRNVIVGSDDDRKPLYVGGTAVACAEAAHEATVRQSNAMMRTVASSSGKGGLPRSKSMQSRALFRPKERACSPWVGGWYEGQPRGAMSSAQMQSLQGFVGGRVASLGSDSCILRKQFAIFP